LDLFQAIFHPRCMVMVKIVRIRVKVSVSVNMVRVRMGMENSAYHVFILHSCMRSLSRIENNTEQMRMLRFWLMLYAGQSCI